MYSRSYSDDSKKHFFIKIVLLAVALFQVVSSFFIPAEFERAGEWIPLFSGFLDLEIVNTASSSSIIAGLVSVALLLLSVYIVNDRLFSNISESFTAVTVAATLVFCNPHSIYFSSISLAAICLIWAIYCLFMSQIFSSFFLMSLGALFFAPVILIIPVMMIVTLIRAPEPLKAFLKSLGGAFTPAIYIISFRYLEFNDVGVFCSQYAEQVTQIKFAFFSKHMTDLFMLLCIAITSCHAIIKTFSSQRRNNIAEAKGLRLVILASILCASIYFLYSGSANVPLCTIVAPALAMIVSNFFTNWYDNPSVRIEIIIVLCSFIVARLGYFVS